MTKKILNNRLLMLSEIEERDINKIIEAIYQFNEDDEEIDVEKRSPIKIILKSEGGSMYDGLALIDVIDNSATPIHITAHGCVMSMALNVLVSGHERFCTKNTTFMYHEGWYNMPNSNIQEHEDELKEAKRLNDLCDSYLISKTKLTTNKLNEIKNSRKNWYFNAKEAFKYNIVNKVL